MTRPGFCLSWLTGSQGEAEAVSELLYCISFPLGSCPDEELGTDNKKN
jgi:hypothetical protein